MPTVFAVARTGTGRPSLQHAVRFVGDLETECGYHMEGWSILYMRTKLSVLLCLKRKKIRGM